MNQLKNLLSAAIESAADICKLLTDLSFFEKLI